MHTECKIFGTLFFWVLSFCDFSFSITFIPNERVLNGGFRGGATGREGGPKSSEEGGTKGPNGAGSYPLDHRNSILMRF